MPKKKKGKGNKLARMSDEERARYLQHRAELELEAKRRKQQLIAIFTKHKLKREEAFSRLNTAKINEQWRFILRRIKCKELYDDVEYLWKNFDRIMKAKDFIIQRLYGELDTADADHRRLQEAHIQTIDLIIERYKQTYMHLRAFFTRERDRIAVDESSELNRMQKDLEMRCNQVQNIIFGQDVEIRNRLSESKIQNAINVHSIIYLKQDSFSHLMQYTSNEIEGMWRQLDEIITEYENSTSDKRKQFEYLKEQDDAYRMDMAQYPRMQMQLQSLIKNLKRDIYVLSQKREQRIEELEDQIARMRETTQSLRHEFLVVQMLDATQIKKLTVISINILKELKRISGKGSALLTLLKMCSSLEPFSLVVQKYTLRDTESRAAFTSCISEPFDKLEKFWEQLNCIRADNIFTKKEYNKLSFENKQLRSTLRTYLITISRIPAARPFIRI